MKSLQSSQVLNTYRRCYSKCCQALLKSSLAINYETELYPLLYNILYCSLLESGIDLDCMIDVNEYIDSATDFVLFCERNDFYHKIATGSITPRGDWMLGVQPDTSNNLIRMLVAFGDIVTNPACGKDYENAPILIANIFDCRMFTKIIVDEMTPIIGSEFQFLIDGKPIDRHTVSKSTPVEKPHPSAPCTPTSTRKKLGRETITLITLLLVAACILFTVIRVNISTNKSSTTTPSRTPTVRYTPSPIQTISPTPVFSASPLELPQTGQMILKSDYVSVCPFSVSAPPSMSCYVYLRYIKAPQESYDHRRSSGYGEESDLAFFVRAGETAEITVPVGVYKFYYAIGLTWYGSEYKFGPNTLYYSSGEWLEFYTTYNTAYGNTLDLEYTYNGNFETNDIQENSFPG